MTKLILGIETSCDETAVAVVNGDGNILVSLLHSQVEDHKAYGGVVPELAARAHLEKLSPLVEEALTKASIKLEEISAIAATCGPGLIGGIVVGAMYGKGLAASLGKPFIAINHLEGHALTIRLTHKLGFPYLLLLASGGHCQFIDVRSLGDYRLLGQTIDDAAGEAFDKVASMLHLPYPGGPHIEKLALSGNPGAFNFPRPLLRRAGCDFSFSGLKTAVRHFIQQNPYASREDICASFQQAVIDCIVDRTHHAVNMLRVPTTSLVIAGGVAANKAIYGALKEVARAHTMTAYAPPLDLCTDNAAMIAWAGVERFKQGLTHDLSFEPRPRWPLTEM